MYPFIDIAVHEAVRKHFSIGEPVIVVTSDFDNIIWANGPSAELFGFQTIYDFMEEGIIEGKKTRKKLREAARQLLGNNIVKTADLQIMRKSDGTRLDITLQPIALSKHDDAMLVIFNKGQTVAKGILDVDHIISGFDDTGACVAVLGHRGQILGATEQYYALDITMNERKSLVQEATGELDRLVKRPISTSHGSLPSAIGYISDEPAMFLQFVIDEVISEDEVGSSETFEATDQETSIQDEDNQILNALHSDPKDVIEEEVELEPTELETDPNDSGDVESDTPDAIDNDTTSQIETDHDVVTDTEATAQDGPETADEDRKEFEFNPNGRAVRFVWKTDAASIFTEISPELSQAVGPNAANIIGRRFADVALVFNLNPSEEILELIRRRDTWSGKTVMWPVQGTDMVIPVDLAALPTYTRDRLFDGYRGFGVARIQEAVNDPEAIGFALVEGPHQEIDIYHDEEDQNLSEETEHNQDISSDQEEMNTADVPADEDDPFKGEVPVLAARETPLRRKSDKIVHLNELREEAKEKLTEDEQAAFFEIRNHLSKLNEQFPDSQSTDDAPATSGEDIDDQTPVEHTLEKHTLDEQEQISDTAENDLEATLEDDLVEQPVSEDSITDELPSDELVEDDDHDITDGDEVAAEDESHSFIPSEPDISLVPENDDQLERLKIKISDLTSILETATDGVVIIDQDSHIQSINASASALFDYSQEETSGKPFSMLFAPESQNAILDYMNAMTEHGVASILNDGREVLGQVSSGGTLPLSMTIGRLSGSNGYCAVLRDITQSKYAEDELRLAKQDAESANSHKTDFLARVSHEIRTPLNAIIGFSDIISQEGFGPVGHSRYVEYANDISKSGRHVLDIVNDLLDISKIEAGQQELDFQSVSLNDEITEALAILHKIANDARVLVRSSMPPSLPKVVADKRSIKQILINIISNSIRHTSAGGQIVISTSLETNGSVLLRIRDNGIGMTRDELDRAMKAFGQVGQEVRSKGDGTGLGLPLTKAMTEANRAKFDIVSSPGEGTLVTIHFPPQRVLAE